RVAETEICGRDVIEHRRLLDVEQPEVALADVLRLLEADEGLLVLTTFDIGSPEAAVVLDQRRRVGALGGFDEADGIDEVLERGFDAAQLGLDEPERREICGIRVLALLALRS